MPSGIHANERQRALRAEQILDAAEKVVLSLGYKKLSVDAVAREAGVGKGTLYLHWSSREDLLYALIAREMAAFLTDLNRFVAISPEHVRLGLHTAETYRICRRRPLTRALFTRDEYVLGLLADHEDARHMRGEKSEGMKLGLERLRRAGLVRQDAPAGALILAVRALLSGMLLASAWPDGEPEMEEGATMLAHLLETAYGANPDSPAPASLQLAWLEAQTQLQMHYLQLAKGKTITEK